MDNDSHNHSNNSIGKSFPGESQQHHRITKTYAIEELIDFVQSDVTVYGTLPKNLPDPAIRQFIETRALPWFYQNYQYAVSKMYYKVDKMAFCQEEWTNYSYITLPCEIQSVTWVKIITNTQLLQLGINTPNMSINMGVTNQPYLSSYVTTIGELGVYKTMIDNLSDMLDQMNLFTAKYHYNQLTNRLNVLTGINSNLMLETYANIPSEHLFTDQYFIKYVTAWAKQQQGRMLGQFDFTLPGGVKYNSADMITQGKEEMKEVEDEIKGMSQTAWFIMVKK